MRPASVCALIAAVLAPASPAAAPPGDDAFAAASALGGEAAKRVAGLEKERQRLAGRGEFDRALVPARAALAARRREQGEKHWQAVDAAWAVRTLEKVSAMPAEDQARLRRALRQRDEAKTLNDAGQADKADALVRPAVRALRALLGDDHPETARAMHRLADATGNQGQLDDALAAYQRLLKARRRLFGEEHPETAECHADIGAILNEQGRYAEAIVSLRRGLRATLRTRGEKDPQAAMIYNNLAFSHAHLDRHDEAAALQRRCLALRRELHGDAHAETVEARGNLAAILNEVGRFEEAQRLLRDALAGWRKLGQEDHPRAALAWNNLGFSLAGRGLFADAQPCLERALAIRRGLFGDRHPDTALVYGNLGAMYNEMHRPEDALPLLLKATDLYNALGMTGHPHAARNLANTAYSLASLGKTDEATRLYEKALAATPRRGRPGRVVLQHLLDLGAAYNEARRYDAAWRVLSYAVPLAEQTFPEDSREVSLGRNNLATTLLARGRHEAALRGYRAAYEARRRRQGEHHHETQMSANNLAYTLHAMKRYREAEQWADRATRTFAQVRLRAAATGLERASLSGRHYPTDLLAVLRVRRGAGAQGWQALEESLGAALRDDLAIRRLFDARQAARHQELASELTRLDRQLLALGPLKGDEAEARRAALLREQDRALRALRELQAEVASRHGPPAGEVYSLARVQKQLPDDAALVAWLDLENSVPDASVPREHWVCVVRSAGEPRWVKLAGFPGTESRADAERFARALRELTTPAGSGADWKAWAAATYRVRVAPLADALKAGNGLPAARRLVVLPSASAQVVPLEAVLEARPEGAPTWVVSHAPSATVFAHLRERRRKAGPPQGLLALGDPAFSGTAAERRRGGEFAPLPGTRREVEAIAGLFEKPRTLLGGDASEQSLEALAEKGQLARYRYVHLATHGKANSLRPLTSFLALADRDLPDPARRVLEGKPAYTGRLTADQIFSRWRLDADLVVLSACESGLGRYNTGEGFIGFAQALFLAGARSVVVSQWSVDDEATALLMVRFYENLLGKRKGLTRPMAKAEALREAKAWLRGLPAGDVKARLESLPRGKLVARPKARKEARPFARPYYWAGFVLVGDPD